MPERVSALASVIHPGLHGAVGADEDRVSLQEVTGLGVQQIAAWPGTVDAVSRKLGTLIGADVTDSPNRAAGSDEARVIWVGPGRWLVLSKGEARAAEIAAEFTVEEAAVTDLSHSRTVIRVSGARSRDVLNKGLPIDLHPRAFSVDSAVQSAIHHMGVLVHLRDTPEADEFDLYVFGGFAQSLWEFVFDAAEEYGVFVAEAA